MIVWSPELVATAGAGVEENVMAGAPAVLGGDVDRHGMRALSTRRSARERLLEEGDRTVDRTGAVTRPRLTSEGQNPHGGWSAGIVSRETVKSLDLRGRAGQDRHLMRRSGRAT